jgi:hypothetical protein
MDTSSLFHIQAVRDHGRAIFGRNLGALLRSALWSRLHVPSAWRLETIVEKITIYKPVRDVKHPATSSRSQGIVSRSPELRCRPGFTLSGLPS